MASKKIEMYSKKQYELEEIKNKIKEEFDNHKFSDVEFKDEIIRELGDTKTLLLIWCSVKKKYKLNVNFFHNIILNLQLILNSLALSNTYPHIHLGIDIHNGCVF